MKVKTFAICLFSLCVSALAQSPDSMKYAPYPILLLSGNNSVESVMPMVFTVDGQQHLEFVPSSKIKESMDKGGHPVTLADVLSALGAATEKVNELQAENDRLWKVAMKDAPRPETVIVQQPAPTSAPSQADLAAQQQAEANARRQQAIQTWLMLQNMNRQQNVNINVRNCTAYPALCVGR